MTRGASGASDTGPARLRIEEVSGVEGLRGLLPAWHDLWRRVTEASPFSSPAWLLPWCERLGDGVTPWTLAAWRGESLAGLAPTFTYEDRRGRVLALLGGGVSDHQDVLGDPGAVDAIARHLVARGDRFDVADLQSVPPWSLLVGAVLRSGVRPRVGPEATGAAIALGAGLADLAPRASRNLLRDVAYQRRRLAREGGLRVVRATAPEAVGGALEALFALHGALWRSRGREGVLADERVRDFHRAAALALLASGALRLFTLEVGGKPFAASYGMYAHGRSYLYLFGTDPDEARRSPGSLVVAQAIEDAIADGATELDLLRGDEPYKERWGATRRTTVRVQFRPREAQAAGRPLPRARDVGQRACPPRSS